ncbi:hypothetical protein EDC96DRAFT_492317 [Choanephora cucurbitarum]|nr:hypothetical protein EDC96DRAFT_492317 [Choanephora cucurbitarum]
MPDLIAHCLERLNLEEPDKVKGKANQFFGQLNSLPVKLFDKGPNLKAVIAIQLAYESLGYHDWSVRLASQLAGCTSANYDSVLSNIRKHLNIQPSITLDTLSIALGSSTMLNSVRDLWDSFTADYLEELKGIKRANAEKELELPCWKGAVTYCCAKAFGEVLPKDRLHALCGCSLAELNKCIKIIQSTSEEKITELKNTSSKPSRASRRSAPKEQTTPSQTTTVKPKTTKKVEATKKSEATDKPESRKRKRTVQSAAIETSEKTRIRPKSGIVSMINHQDYKKSKRYLDYIEWKSRLIQQLNSSLA